MTEITVFVIVASLCVACASGGHIGIAGVIGSVLADCEKQFLRHTVNGSSMAVDMSPTYLTGFSTLRFKWVTDVQSSCRVDYGALLDYCTKTYASPGGSIAGVVAGPTTFPSEITASKNSPPDDRQRLVRPYWCLKDLNSHPSLHTPNNCQLYRLPHVETMAQKRIQQCFSQAEWEDKARLFCRRPYSKENQNPRQLYSAYPLASCGRASSKLPLFSAVEFVCCGRPTGDIFNTAYRTDVELPVAFKTSSFEDTHKQSQRTQSIAESYLRQFQQLASSEESQRNHLSQQFLEDAQNIKATTWLTRKQLAELSKEALVAALQQLEELWSRGKENWETIEDNEHEALEAALEPSNQAEARDFDRGMMQPEPLLSQVQTTLANLLHALEASIEESVRHLMSLTQRAPWHLLQPVPNSPTHLTILGKLEKELVDHVGVAQRAITRLNQLMGQLSVAGHTAVYSPLVRRNYANLSAVLRRARHFLLIAKGVARKQLMQVDPANRYSSVERTNGQDALFRDAIRRGRNSVWQVDGRRRAWIQATQGLDSLVKELMQQTNITAVSTKKIGAMPDSATGEPSGAGALMNLTLVTTVTFGVVCVVVACLIIWLCCRSRTASPQNRPLADAAGGNSRSSAFMTKVINSFSATANPRRRFRSLHRISKSAGSKKYRPMHDSQYIVSKQHPQTNHVDASTAPVDAYAEELITRGYENPTYRFCEELH